MEQSRIIHGNALDLPLEDGSVDLVITSPPYFALRSYRDDGGHYDGQVGSEATPAEFLDALWSATREMVRVLKPTGSIWVNLGDKYAGSGGHNNSAISAKSTLTGGLRKLQDDESRCQPATRRNAPDRYNQNAGGAPSKSLMGLPWRYAIGCVDQLGLILRAEVVWSKPNGLPESVSDRVRRSHEQWFHFTKQGRYFSAVDEVREVHQGIDNDKSARGPSGMNRGVGNFARDPLGKVPGSVWTIATEPLIIPEAVATHYNLPDHFAAFPTEWPRRIILGWSPSGVCTACGEGRRPVVDKTANGKIEDPATWSEARCQDNGWSGRHEFQRDVRATISGYACACTPYTDHPERRGLDWNRGLDRGNGNRVAKREADTRGPVREYHFDGWVPPPTTPAVVLDPFAGTGTVPMVARALGRTGIGVELSKDYVRLANWRVFRSGHGARAERRTWGERQMGLL